MLDSQNKTQVLRSVMKAIYNLSDEDNYSVYGIEDISTYLGLREDIVDEAVAVLWDAGCLQECMTFDDDGHTTYALTDKAIDMVEMG